MAEFEFDRIISFDMGVKNLSLCILDINCHKVKIIKWSIIQLRGNNISDFTKDMINKLRIENFQYFDYALIEQQINRNTQMKVLSHVLQTYFICECKTPPENVIFVNPKIRCENNSLKYTNMIKNIKLSLNLPNKLSRREYKFISIATTNFYLSCDPACHEWLAWFNSQDKKDDLSDSFIQSVAWVHSTSKSAMQSSVMDID